MDNNTLTKEQLLMKAEGVKDCVKWIEDKLKSEKQSLIKDKELESIYGMYEDCGESYRNEVIKGKARMEALIEAKVSLEKYKKKLKYEAEEV
jgi:hypothetical protein